MVRDLFTHIMRFTAIRVLPHAPKYLSLIIKILLVDIYHQGIEGFFNSFGTNIKAGNVPLDEGHHSSQGVLEPRDEGQKVCVSQKV
jgi:hypothetical protein